MPLYEYRCENGHTFEVLQKMSDDPMTDCTVCGVSVRRVFAPPAIHFKGSGFYNTDYGKRKGAGDSSKDDGASVNGKSEGKGDSKGKGESKGKESAQATSTSGSGSSD